MAAVVLAQLGMMLGTNTLALSATLTKASISGQVQQFTDSGVVTGCGLTVMALETPTSRYGKLAIFNGSFSLMGAAGGLIKGRFSEIDAPLVFSGKTSPKDVKALETTSVWMKAPGHEVTMPIQGSTLTKSEDPGYLIYVSSLKSILKRPGFRGGSNPGEWSHEEVPEVFA